MKKFEEIKQFRDVIREVTSNHDYCGKDENGNPKYLHSTDYPILSFKGTVKLHGTNSSIVKYNDSVLLDIETAGDSVFSSSEKVENYVFQSRERELSLTSDNSSFMNEMVKKNYKKLFDGIEFNEYCAIYGEWCGSGIQKGVAISQLPKMFVIFAVKIDGVYQNIENYSHLKIEDEKIYNITQFPSFSIDIDFNNPKLVQNKLGEITLEVEKECPVGKYFGVSGVGEGVVWECLYNDKRYVFKVKGEKHQVSKVKTLAPVDTEMIENMNKFVEYSVTENRLKQGIDKMIEMGHPLDMKSTSHYLRWVYNDIVKEESDTIEKNGIDVKKLGGYISNKAKVYWFNYLNENV